MIILALCGSLALAAKNASKEDDQSKDYIDDIKVRHLQLCVLFVHFQVAECRVQHLKFARFTVVCSFITSSEYM